MPDVYTKARMERSDELRRMRTSDTTQRNRALDILGKRPGIDFPVTTGSPYKKTRAGKKRRKRITRRRRE